MAKNAAVVLVANDIVEGTASTASGVTIKQVAPNALGVPKPESHQMSKVVGGPSLIKARIHVFLVSPPQLVHVNGARQNASDSRRLLAAETRPNIVKVTSTIIQCSLSVSQRMF